MIKFAVALICLVLLNMTLVEAQQNDAPIMKKYTFVLLKKGENRNQDSASIVVIQKGHMDHINEMAQNGDLNVAGPFLDDGFFRGIFIFNTEDTVKVKKLIEADPAIKSGRLAYEMHPWMTQKGTVFK
ncbi:MAG: hypothetical protein IPP71_12190 [Bacteroidetes bacterium]|nr:hypothetical protein [Bacteroidota bacterium]